MKEVREFVWSHPAVGLHINAPGIADAAGGEFYRSFLNELVEFLDSFGVLRGSRHDEAKDQRHVRPLPVETVEDLFDVIGGVFGGSSGAEVIGSDEEDHGFGFEEDHIVLHPVEDPAGHVTADASIGHLHAGKEVSQILPALGNGIAKEDHGVLVLKTVLPEELPAADPNAAKPGSVSDRTPAGKGIVRLRKFCDSTGDFFGRWGRLLCGLGGDVGKKGPCADGGSKIS